MTGLVVLLYPNIAYSEESYQAPAQISSMTNKNESIQAFRKLQQSDPQKAAELLEQYNNQSQGNGEFSGSEDRQNQDRETDTTDDKNKNRKFIKESKKPEISALELLFQDRILRNLLKKTKADYENILRQFGYDLFSDRKTGLNNKTSTVFTNMPVTDDYLIGPGDEFTITLWGMVEGLYAVKVDRNGDITLPKAGVVHIAGLKHAELTPFLKKQFARFYSKFNMSISMEKLRQINVYVAGSVSRPGAYIISPFSTVLDVLLYAGGPTKNGTLRDIKVIRNGKTIANIDLYSFLLTGEGKPDIRLAAEDTVFVSLIGNTIAVSGSVYRSAIYETKEAITIGTLLKMAGGVRPNAYLKKVKIKRVKEHEKNIVIDIDLLDKTKNSENTPLENMDIVSISSIFDITEDMVSLNGHVKRPGEYQLKKGFKVKDIIENYGSFLPEAYLDYAEIIRYELPLFTRRVLPFNLLKAMDGDQEHNLTLHNRDQIRIYSEAYFKDKKLVTIDGEVKKPGLHRLYSNITLRQLIKQIGGLTNNAYIGKGDIYRVLNYDNPEIGREIITFDLGRILDGSEDLELKPLDKILIYSKSYFEDEQNVIILGEVRHPSSLLKKELIQSISGKPRMKNDLQDIDKKGAGDKEGYIDELIEPCEEELIDPVQETNYNTDKENKEIIENDSMPAFEEIGQDLGMTGLPIAGNELKSANTNQFNAENVLATSALAGGLSNKRTNKTERSSAKDKTLLRSKMKQKRICSPQTHYKFYTGMRLSDLVRQAGGLTEDAYMERVEIHRVVNADNTTYKREILFANLKKSFTDKSKDIPLKVHDTVLIYSKWAMNNIPKVFIDGAVKNPGEIQLLRGMRIKDLIYRAGLDMNSYLYEAELTRYQVNRSAAEVMIKRLPINIQRALQDEEKYNILLKDGDRLLVKPITELRPFKTITLKGEVKFPGVYTIDRGERLSSIIKRAGGYTSLAYLKGAVFTRRSVRKRESEQLRKFVREQEKRLISYSASLSTSGLDKMAILATSTDREIKERELELIASRENLGRMVVHLEPLEKMESSESNLLLEDGDTLFIPEVPSEISVMGSVRNPISFTYSEKLIAMNYIQMAGGFSKEADKEETYILKVDGTSIEFDKKTYLDPGDSIIVPPSVETKYRLLPLWRDIMTIVGQTAVTIVTILAIF